MTPSLGTSPSAEEMLRIVVVGCSCAGKTTFSRRLAQIIAVPYVEWDRLHWASPRVPNDPQLFSALVAEAVMPERWVLEGVLHRGYEPVLERMTMVIWLNYSFRRVLWQAMKKSGVVRLRHPTHWRGAASIFIRLLIRHSPLLRVITTYRSRQKQYRLLLDIGKDRHLKIIEFRKPIEAEEFLRGLKVHQPQVS